MKAEIGLLVRISQSDFRVSRNIAVFLVVLLVGACASRSSTEVEQAAAEPVASDRASAEQVAAEQARIAAEEEVARASAEQVREQEAAAERERQAKLAEQQRQESEQQRLATLAAARARAESEAQARVEQQRRQQEAVQAEQRRKDAIAQAQEERDEKLATIAALESQIETVEANIEETEAVNGVYQEAILVSEELINVLTDEQAKYENVDENGNTVEPLAKELISDLENRKNSLLSEAQARAR